MPSAYTNELYHGAQPFPDFVLRCARAMGALITMRDDPLDAPIPEQFAVSDWWQTRINDARDALTKAETITLEESEALASTSNTAQRRLHDDLVARIDARRDRYKAMLDQVAAWEPPTADHLGLKEFMLEQLTSSLGFDAWVPAPPTEQSAAEFRETALSRAREAVAKATRDLTEETERVRQRNEWITALRASLREDVTIKEKR